MKSKGADFFISAFALAVVIVFLLALYKNVTDSSISRTGIPGAGTTPEKPAEEKSLVRKVWEFSPVGRAWNYIF